MLAHLLELSNLGLEVPNFRPVTGEAEANVNCGTTPTVLELKLHTGGIPFGSLE